MRSSEFLRCSDRRLNPCSYAAVLSPDGGGATRPPASSFNSTSCLPASFVLAAVVSAVEARLFNEENDPLKDCSVDKLPILNESVKELAASESGSDAPETLWSSAFLADASFPETGPLYPLDTPDDVPSLAFSDRIGDGTRS